MDLTGGPLFDTTSTGLETGLQGASSMNPIGLAATLLSAIIPSLFGPTEQQKKRRDVNWMEQYLNRFYMPSPQRVGAMTDVTTQAIMNNLGRAANWGWPSGATSMDTSFLNDFLAKQLGK